MYQNLSKVVVSILKWGGGEQSPEKLQNCTEMWLVSNWVKIIYEETDLLFSYFLTKCLHILETTWLVRSLLELPLSG